MGMDRGLRDGGLLVCEAFRISRMVSALYWFRFVVLGHEARERIKNEYGKGGL